MLLFVFLLCCVLQPILHYHYVFGKRESLQRFLVEDGAKPAIFGSYSYDPVKQVFVPPPPDANHSSIHHHQPHSITQTDTERETQTEPETQTERETETETQTGTETGTETQTGTETETGTEIETHSSIDTLTTQSVVLDLFMSTAGDTGTDSPAADDTVLRKHVPPNSKPWWARSKTTFKNVTFNFI